MNCKPGDMAVVIRDDEFKEIGLIVEVLSFDEIDEDGDYCWNVKPVWPCTTYNRKTGSVDFGVDEFGFPDAWLRPIRQPETPVTETRDEELAA